MSIAMVVLLSAAMVMFMCVFYPCVYDYVYVCLYVCVYLDANVYMYVSCSMFVPIASLDDGVDAWVCVCDCVNVCVSVHVSWFTCMSYYVLDSYLCSCICFCFCVCLCL